MLCYSKPVLENIQVLRNMNLVIVTGSNSEFLISYTNIFFSFSDKTIELLKRSYWPQTDSMQQVFVLCIYLKF